MNIENIIGIAGLVLLLLIFGLINGSFTEAIMSRKGYGKSYFWKGFFGGPLADRRAYMAPEAEHGGSADTDDDTPILLKNDTVDVNKEPDAWQCVKCCKWNHHYMANCSCGNSKVSNAKMIQRASERIQELEKNEKSEIENDESELTNTEQILINLIASNPDGISGMNIAKSIPRSIPSHEATEALKHLCESDMVEKLDNGCYVKK